MLENDTIRNPSLLESKSAPNDIGEASGGIDYSIMLDSKNPVPDLKTVGGKVKVFSKMKSNSTISGILLAFTSICQTPKVIVNENKDDPDRERAESRAKFLEQCLDDMQTPFSDVRGEILDMIAMGFKVMVPQFKARTGYDPDISFNSKYKDGKIGWKNFKPIDPETIEKWNTPEGGGYLGLTGITQRISRNGKEIRIPRNRMLVFRTSASNNSPIGRSLLEGAYDDWVDLVDANKIQMTGLRRSLEGIPFARIHTELASKSQNSPSIRSAIEAAKKTVRDLDAKRDNGFVLPADRDDGGNLLVDVRMMGAADGGGNTRIQDAKIVIDAKEQTIARSMLAQFMTIQGKGGSYALSKTQSEVFVNSLKGYMTQTEGVMNNEAIPRLFAINGEGVNGDDHYLPTIHFSEFIRDDITEFFGALQKAIEGGVFEVTPQIQKKAGQVLGIDISGQKEALSERKDRQRELSNTQQSGGINDELSVLDGVGGGGIPDTKSSDITDEGLKEILEA